MGWLLVPLALLAVAYVGWSRVTPWSRYFAPHLAVAAGLAIFGAAIVGWWKSRRGEAYYAKWLDLTNGLDDRLTSAWEWSGLKTADDFQRRCVEQLAEELTSGRRKLTLPGNRPRRLALTFGAVALLGAAVGFHLRRPPPIIEQDARRRAELPKAVSKAAGDDAAAVRAAADQAADPEVRKLSEELSGLLNDLEHGEIDRQTALARADALRQRAAALQGSLANLSGARGAASPDAVGALSRALNAGEVADVKKAMDELAGQLQGGKLDDNQLSELAPTIEALSRLSKGDPSSESLRRAAKLMASGDQAGAAKHLQSATKDFPSEKARQSLLTAAAAGRAERAASSLQAAVGQTLLPGSGSDGRGNNAQGDPGATAGVNGAFERLGSSGAGAQAVAQHEAAPFAPQTTGPDVRVHGVWKGDVMQRLFNAPQSAESDVEAKQLLVDHERVIEDRFRRDEIPREYQDAVRAYFSSLHAQSDK